MLLHYFHGSSENTKAEIAKIGIGYNILTKLIAKFLKVASLRQTGNNNSEYYNKMQTMC